MKAIRFCILAVCFAPFFVFAQVSPTWRLTSAPRFRQVKALHFVSDTNWVVLGGNETNDPISSIFGTPDCGNYYDIWFDNIYKCINDAYSMSGSEGIAVGNDGLVLRTHDAWHSWDTMSLPANVASRQLNGVWFTSLNTGFAVGGNPKMDSIQTILKTTDSGNTWSIIADNLGPMLREVHFINLTTGFAVGDSNVVLRTTDSGATWNPVSLPSMNGKRVLQQVKFRDANYGFIVGGMPGADSLSLMLMSTNAGQNWSIARDNAGSMLNDIDFYSATGGYMAGDDGVIFNTTDGGLIWNPVTLSVSQNDTFSFEVVDFRSQDFGVLGGRSGKVLIWSAYVVGREDAIQPLSFQIAPNPAERMVRISWDSHTPRPRQISLMDISGRIHRHVESGFGNCIPLQSVEWDLSDLSQGVYLLKWESDTGTETARLLVQ